MQGEGVQCKIILQTSCVTAIGHVSLPPFLFLIAVHNFLIGNGANNLMSLSFLFNFFEATQLNYAFWKFQQQGHLLLYSVPAISSCFSNQCHLLGLMMQYLSRQFSNCGFIMYYLT